MTINDHTKHYLEAPRRRTSYYQVYYVLDAIHCMLGSSLTGAILIVSSALLIPGTAQ